MQILLEYCKDYKAMGLTIIVQTGVKWQDTDIYVHKGK